MSSGSISFSIGLEFEFALVQVLPDDLVEDAEQWIAAMSVHEAYFRARLEQADNLRRELATRIRSKGIECGMDEDDHSSWQVTVDSTILPTNSVNDPETGIFKLVGGQVVREPSTDPDRRQLGFVPVELISPVLQFEPESFETTIMAEIALVLETVQAMPAYLNRSCGFHVHIGQQNFGFSLNTLKNFLILVACGQFQLDRIFPPDRLINDICIPVTAFMNPDEIRNVWRIAQVIENVESIEELLTLVHLPRESNNPGRNLYEPTWDRSLYRFTTWNTHNLIRYRTWNFMNLGPDNIIKKTIECRQHHATIDVNTVRRWILLTTSLVRLSDTPNFIFAPILVKIGRFEKSDYNLLQFLNDLGLGHIGDMYEGHTFENHDYPENGLPYGGPE